MYTQLIDRDGEVWDAQSGRLRSLYHVPLGLSPNGTRNFVDFLVRNAGFVAVGQTGNNYAVSAAPGSVSLTCYLATGQQIGDDASRVSLSWYDGQWHHEIHGGRDRAMKRLLALMGEHAGSGNLNRHLSVVREVVNANLTDHHVELLSLWRDRSGMIDLRRDGETLHNVTLGKFLFTARDTETSRLVFSGIGQGYELYNDESWQQKSYGRRVEDQPDVRYGTWVANCYREAMLANEPTLMSVDAVVSDPKQGERRRMQYTRLTLPCIDRQGRTHLLSASVVDYGIDLRIEAHQEAK